MCHGLLRDKVAVTSTCQHYEGQPDESSTDCLTDRDGCPSTVTSDIEAVQPRDGNPETRARQACSKPGEEGALVCEMVPSHTAFVFKTQVDVLA